MSVIRHPPSVLLLTDPNGPLSHALMLLPFIVATNTNRYEQRFQSDPTQQPQMKAVGQLLNCEM